MHLYLQNTLIGSAFKPLLYEINGHKLDKANLVGNIHSLNIAGQTNIRLLGTIRADQGVYAGSINIIQSLNGILDVLLVGTDINNKHQRVVLFDFTHGAFSGQWEFDDAEFVHTRIFWDGFPRIFGSAGFLQGFWETEGG